MSGWWFLEAVFFISFQQYTLKVSYTVLNEAYARHIYFFFILYLMAYAVKFSTAVRKCYAKSHCFMLWIAVLSFAICPPLLNQSYSMLGSEQQNKGEIELFILIFIINYKFKHLSVLLVILWSIFLEFVERSRTYFRPEMWKRWEHIFLELRTVTLSHSVWEMGKK